MNIKSTLQNTKASTFSVFLPNPKQHDFPTPVGTGFFVSPDGWFITAAHVLTAFSKDSNKPTNMITIEKETLFDVERKMPIPKVVNEVKLVHYDPGNDFALLKADIEKNHDQLWLANCKEFPYIKVGTKILEDGDEVYSFGYPLSTGGLIYPGPEFVAGTTELHPRVTSAIVSSIYEKFGMISHSGVQRTYILDKALNYGNSGGPIVSKETGEVNAFCSRFQPVYIPQKHLGEKAIIMIPSLYGVVTNLSFSMIEEVLVQKGIVQKTSRQ
ncbi:MAG: serine protease [Desulfobacterales bacterium]|nr:serine protease [Desulfobacterales bacterium]